MYELPVTLMVVLLAHTGVLLYSWKHNRHMIEAKEAQITALTTAIIQMNDQKAAGMYQDILARHKQVMMNKDQEAFGEETVFEGELQPDQPSFPFSFPLPAGPVSYAGHYINIVWQVSASLDLAWKRDPHTEQTFFLTLP